MKSWIELDLARLNRNIDSLRSALSSSTEIIYVVKANAYGHGVRQIAEGAWSGGVRWYAVAHVSEAQELREVLPEAKILIIGSIAPDEARECIAGGFVPVLTSLEHAKEIAEVCQKERAVLACHIKIDTGMGRLGIHWQEALPVIKEIAAMEGIRAAGICTHFASSDAETREYFDEQRSRFADLLDDLDAAGIDPGFRHVSNSGAVLLEPGADWDGVRPGIMLYGYCSGALKRDLRIEPVLQWKARVGQVRSVTAGSPISYNSTYVTREDTRIAVLDVGYADGYPRSLSNRGEVLIGGQRLPVVGTVTMSLIMVDAGPDSSVRQGDEAVLIGEQGGESIWADELAAASGTITYDILTALKPGSIKVV